jgi:hypothetical protein
MTEGISALSRTQIGFEALPGGSTDAPTTVWRGMGMLQDKTRVVFPREKIGKLGGTTRSYIPENGGEVTLEGGGTFEQIGYLFEAGIKSVLPTTDASSGQTWLWAVQHSDSDPISTTDLATLVVETGDNIQAEIARFGFVREMNINGSAGEALEVSGIVQTREVSPATFTAGLTVPLIEEILFSLGSLYIDDTTGTIGTTVISNTLLDMSLKFTTGWAAKKTKDNRLDFSFIKRADDEIVLDITFEHNSIAVAEKAAWKAQTERAIRLEFLGSALSTTDSGSDYDTKAFVIDLYGKWETFGAAGLEEVDGNNVYKGTFRVGYSPTADAKASFLVVNELAALP